MRVWDIHPSRLCRQHLLGEHRELHGLWNILTVHGGKGGYSRHPETMRWKGKLRALYVRHDALMSEMKRRGYQHNTPLDKKKASGSSKQNILIDTIAAQMRLLQEKNCACRV